MTVPSPIPRGQRALVWVVILVVAAALTAAFARPYGVLNQTIYELDPLHRANPELFRRDWFAHDPYLPVYGWLTWWLYALDSEGPIAVLAANFVVSLATYVAIYWLVASLSTGLRGFVLLASFVTVTMGRAMGGSYLLAGYLQPASLATLGWIVAMVALVRGRYLACGIALALSGFIHVNHLVLGIGLFALPAVVALVRREARLLDLAALLVPQLLVLVGFLPDLLAAAGPGREALGILVHFHAPGHYLGRRLISWIPGLVGWQIAAWAALPLIDGRRARMLWWFALSSCAVAVGTAVLIHRPAFEFLTQVRWSRIAPFGQLACQVLVIAAVMRDRTAPASLFARRAWLAAAVALALVLQGRHLHTPWLVIVAEIAGSAAVIAAPRRWARGAGIALAAVALAAALWSSPRGAGLTARPIGSAGELALFDWVRRSTPVDALFLTPPDMPAFRVLARRAIVADTKSAPLQPVLLL